MNADRSEATPLRFLALTLTSVGGVFRISEGYDIGIAIDMLEHAGSDFR